MATNDAIECCDKYENARDFRFGDKLKIMEGGPEDLPTIKAFNRSVEGYSLSGAIGMMAICSSINATFVRESDVGEKRGKPLESNLDRLECLISDPGEILLPLFRRHGGVGIYTWCGDVGIAGRTFPVGESDLAASTTRLARRLMG